MQTLAGLSAFLICIVMYLTGCGLFKSDYKPYAFDPPPAADDGTGTGDDGTDECPAGSQLAAYQTNVAAAVDGTCSGASCHAVISKMLLTAKADDANRQKLYAYTSGDAATFSAFISGSEHKGGNMGSILAATAISAWITAETKCL